MGRHGGEFNIVLQLDTPPNDLLTITYVLSGEPVIDRSSFASSSRGSRPLWLYEKLEAVPEHDKTSFVHSILLSNGWELKLPFTQVRLTKAQPVFPAQRGVVAAKSA